jgi:sterol desaturase/sphingolipid hydroxylase (fatty acid hydroxylase superfamily)
MWNIDFWKKILAIISLRYFIIAGLAFLICYVWLRKKISYKKIQVRFPGTKDYRREIIFSLITMIIFSTVPFFFLGNQSIKATTTFYSDMHQHSRLYFWLAFPLMLLMHDAYFYFTHRLMHHPRLFKWFHLLHHKSTNPSPWAAFAFSPLEALVEIGILVVFLYTIPIMRFHLFFFFLFMMLYNVYGHLGWELYPKNFQRSVIGRWINTSINHNQHHQYFKGNYGLYFLWWDRWFGTLREDYETSFDEVQNRV